MPNIKVRKKNKEFVTSVGSNLMKSLLDHQIPVASSCHGDGVCGKCKVLVLQGAENLSPIRDIEKILIEKYNLKKNERISCQAMIQGDVEVDTGYW